MILFLATDAHELPLKFSIPIVVISILVTIIALVLKGKPKK